jgi:hypothetical protein
MGLGVDITPRPETVGDYEEQQEQGRPSLLAGLRNATWLDAQRFPALSFIVPGIIPEGMSLLIGGPKIGKSWFSLDVALSVAAGGTALGGIAVGQPRPVLLLALEDGDRRLQDRARKLLHGQPFPQRLDYMTRIEPGLVVATMEAWLETLPNVGPPPLIILDTLGKVMTPARNGETTYQNDYRMAGRLKLVADSWPGMGLVVLHHDRKAESADFVDAVSGTNGIAGAADTILVITRQRTETKGVLKVTGRDVTEREYAVEVEDGQWSLIGDTLSDAAKAAVTLKAVAGVGDRSAEVVRYVAAHPAGVRAADTGKAVGMSDKDAGTYLLRLYDERRIDRAARGLYVPVGSVGTVGNSLLDDPLPTLPTLPTPPLTPCDDCGEPLDPVVAAKGETTHATCTPTGKPARPLDAQPAADTSGTDPSQCTVCGSELLNTVQRARQLCGPCVMGIAS